MIRGAKYFTIVRCPEYFLDPTQNIVQKRKGDNEWYSFGDMPGSRMGRNGA
jgi:hypothetical protein